LQPDPRNPKTNQIPNVLYSSPSDHMNTLDQELKWLLNEGSSRAKPPSSLQKKIPRI